MLKAIGSVFSFLTILPTNSSSLETVAKYMYLFPLVGLGIGLIVGGFGFGLSYVGIDPLVVSLIVVASLAIITGIHHTDGLADFADGLMTKGKKSKKLAAMKDLSTGTAGIFSIVLYVVALIIALSMTDMFGLFTAILLGEVLAKFSMVLMATMGKSASLGSNSPFVQLAKDKRKLIIAAAFTIVPLVVLAGPIGLILLLGTVAVTLFLTGIATKSFGGITGDVLGATNELTRLSSILIFVSL